VLDDQARVTLPEDMDPKRVLLETKGTSMGLSRDVPLDIIVYVDPVRYYEMPYSDKPSVAKMIGRINWHYRYLNTHMMLFVPGRIGTSSPELGVPVSFSDISAFEAICEIEEKKAGYNPELSYGSHIFQDLVEADILYTAAFDNEKTVHFSPEKLEKGRDISSDFDEDGLLFDIVKVVDMSGQKCNLYHDLKGERLLITMGF
jgi:hypothetical protein